MGTVVPRVIRNSAMCLLCGEEIVSVHPHDFRMCRCGNISVDGGHAYARRVFRTQHWEDTSVYGRGDNSGISVEDGR
jgi:hypothetical protein